jgi:hypothetical protein
LTNGILCVGEALGLVWYIVAGGGVAPGFVVASPMMELDAQ